jgi:hypothetical protein
MEGSGGGVVDVIHGEILQGGNEPEQRQYSQLFGKLLKKISKTRIKVHLTKKPTGDYTPPPPAVGQGSETVILLE